MSDLPSLPRAFTVRVVGVSFVAGYPHTIGRLEAIAAEAFLHDQRLEPIPAVLMREPDNPRDANAVRIDVPAIGQLGHLPRNMAARLAPRLDAGERWQAAVREVVTNADHPDRPGINVRLDRVEDL